MVQVTLEQLFANRFGVAETKLFDDNKNPSTDDMIEYKKLFCYKQLKLDISCIFENKELIMNSNSYEYSINLSKDPIQGLSTDKDKNHITIRVESNSLDYINISLEDSRAHRSLKNFHIKTIQGSSKGGDDYMHVKRHICLYLKDKEGSWIWKKEEDKDKYAKEKE